MYISVQNSNSRYHQWHFWLLGLSLLPAMAMGIIAALFVEHRIEPNGRFGVPQPSRPGCFVPADPFKVPKLIKNVFIKVKKKKTI